MSFDLEAEAAAAAAHEDGIEITVLDAKGAAMATLKYAGPLSRRWIEAETEAIRFVVAQRRDGEKPDPIAEERVFARRRFAGAALSWEGFTRGEEPMECSFDNVLETLDRSPRFETLCMAAVRRAENFTGN